MRPMSCAPSYVVRVRPRRSAFNSMVTWAVSTPMTRPISKSLTARALRFAQRVRTGGKRSMGRDDFPEDLLVPQIWEYPFHEFGKAAQSLSRNYPDATVLLRS